MFAAEVPDGILFALLPVSFVMVVSLMAWIVRELGKVAVTNARVQEQLDDHERRLERMEIGRIR